MALIEFLRQAPRRSLRLMLALTLLAGAANALLVVAVNTVTEVVARGDRPAPESWAVYALAFAVYFMANRHALLCANAVIERLLRDLRLRVMDRLRRTELTVVNRVGQGNLYTLVSQETNHLSVTVPLVVDAAAQATLLIVALLYLLWLSPAAFGAFLLAVAVGAIGYRVINRNLGRDLALITRRQAQMVDAIADIVHGAKELRLNRRKSDDVLALYRRMSRSTGSLLAASGDHWADLMLLGSLVTYGMLGVVAFGFPALVEGHTLVVFQLIPVLLFCMGPLTRIVAQSPMFVRADLGLRSILEIERQLAEAGGVAPEEAARLAPAYQGFATLSFAGLTYSYRGPGGTAEFTAGPFDLEIRRGELVFLVGGNGSGKSTVLRMMTGLYPADAGYIAVDGKPMVGASIAGFRELFSAVFVDFHLFDRLYGLEGVDPDRVNRLIVKMGLGGKVHYADGRFSRLTLSTGQRKRLALIVALLEDRPVYVFDEWSAEQDVHFREYFYTTILPELKARGKTVIAVTHDERFWHLADRVLKLELGRVVWDRLGRDLEPA